ncbi:MAG: ABC transporter ATP-binding protein [Rhodospirillales bacterium]
MSVLIETHALTKRFGGFTAVDGLSLSVSRSEVLGFLGPNGAGKSTTMRMAAGFLAPTSGTARINGVDVTRQPKAAKQNLGYLPEGAPSYGDMTPLGFLNFAARMRGRRGRELRRCVDLAAERCGLADVMRQPIDTLSKGFRRRVGLAQAVLHEPSALILDEPTDGLDPNQKRHVRRLISDMAETAAVIVSTHILEEVEAVCTRAVIINAGRIVCDDTPANLLAGAPDQGALTLVTDAVLARHAYTETAALAEVGGVHAQPAADSRVRFEISPAPGVQPESAVREMFRARGWPIHSLRARKGTMEAVFRAATGVDEHAPEEDGEDA